MIELINPQQRIVAFLLEKSQAVCPRWLPVYRQNKFQWLNTSLFVQQLHTLEEEFQIDT